MRFVVVDVVEQKKCENVNRQSRVELEGVDNEEL